MRWWYQLYILLQLPKPPNICPNYAKKETQQRNELISFKHGETKCNDKLQDEALSSVYLVGDSDPSIACDIDAKAAMTDQRTQRSTPKSIFNQNR